MAFLDDRYAKSDYPVLEWQCRQWSASRPLEGLEVLDATPLFCNTLLKYRSLIAAGARLTVGLSDFISYDQRALDFVRGELKLRVVDNSHGRYDVVADCAAAYCGADARLGYVELTRSGVEKYKAMGVTVYVADSSLIKRIETEIGTGDSFFRAMAEMGYRDWRGGKLVIFGSGKVGRGILTGSVAAGAKCVVVTDPADANDFVKATAEKVIDFRSRHDVDQAMEGAYAAVMATGVVGAFSRTATVDKVVKSDTILANMGAEDEFGDGVPNERVLREKRTLNFILDEPTHLRYIDATMALHNYGAAFMSANPSARGVIVPSESVEREMLDISCRDGVIASQIEMFQK